MSSELPTAYRSGDSCLGDPAYLDHQKLSDRDRISSCLKRLSADRRTAGIEPCGFEWFQFY